MKLIDVTDEQRREIQRAELTILAEVDRICQMHHIKYIVAYGTLLGAVRHNGFIPWDDDIDICMPRSDYNAFKEIAGTELGTDFFYQDNQTDPEYFYLIDKIRLNGTVFKESFVSKYHIHHGIYIDVFPVDNIPDNYLLRQMQYYKFHFYRTGLMAKYLDLEARTGKKRLLMSVLKAAYCLFPLKFLYKKAIKTASKYSDAGNCNNAGCFFSPYRKKDIFQKDMFQLLERHSFEDIEVNVPVSKDVYLSGIYGDYMALPPLEDRVTKHTITELKIQSSLNIIPSCTRFCAMRSFLRSSASIYMERIL